MSRAVASVGRFAAMRVRWLICLSCFAAGWLTCFAWVLTIHYAPSVAIDLISKVGAMR